MSPDGLTHRINARQKPATRFATGVAAPRRDHADLDHRRRRHVVGGGGAAAGAGRICRAAGASVAAVHVGDGGICLGRRADGPPVRQDRDFGSAGAGSLVVFAIAHGLIGFGSAATLGPLIADISNWFVRRRGVAVTLCSAGNYVAGAMWPPVVQHAIALYGWRATHVGIALTCGAAMILIGVVALRRRAPAALLDSGAATRKGSPAAFGLSARALQTLLALASVCCCVAMSMPQVHIVAYCGDLGYGVARGADMLALMMAFGMVGRIGSGFIADRVGGLPTLMLGSALQGVALLLYILYDGLASLYVISAVFGLFQGGIVPSYAIIVREYFPAKEAGTRVGIVLMMSLFGMALGGWLSGYIYDLSGSYRAAFFNGLAWNAVNGAIVLWLLFRRHSRIAYA